MADGDSTISNNINVAIRLRPLNEREKRANDRIPWNIENDMIYIPSNSNSPTFTFDHIYGPDVQDNQIIYNSLAKPIVDSTLHGFNGTIFAYGQTSAGKTFTMKGTDNNIGLVPLALEHIFRHIQLNPCRVFNIRCSYLEIYNEVITDLLKPENTNLKIHESLSSGVFVGNLSEEPAYTIEEAVMLLVRGEEKRQIGATNINEHSSRSHTLFRMIIESREVGDESENSRESINNGPLNVSVLTFVDLAGSERIGQTGAEGIRLKEGGHINKSLFALTTVISKLADGNDRSHIPYRDSKLTRILQPSLGGNAKTAIICALTPAAEYCEESISTLKFASRAKSIKNKARVNEIISDKVQLKIYQEEIDRLQAQIRLLKESSTEEEHQSTKKRKLNDSEVESLKSIRKELHESIQIITSSDQYPKEIAKLCSELWEEISFLKLELIASLKVNDDLTLKTSIAQAKISELENQNQLANESIGNLQVYKEKAEELELKCKEVYDEMASVEEALMDDLARMNSDNTKLQEQLEQMEVILKSKECINCAQVNAQIDEFCKSLGLLEEKLLKCPRQCDMDALEISYEKKIDNLVESRCLLDAEIKELKEALKLREQDVAAALESLASSKKMERSIEENYESQISNLNSEVNLLNSILSEKVAEFESLQISYSDLEKSRETSSQKIQALTTSLQAAEEKYASLLSDHGKLKELENEISIQLLSARENEAALSGRASKLESEVTALRNEQDEFKAQRLAFNGLSEILEHTKRELAELKLQKYQRDEEVKSLQHDLGIKEKDLKDASCTLISKLETITCLEATIKQSEIDLAKVTDFWKDQLSQMKQDSIHQTDSLQSIINELQEGQNKLLSENSKLCAQLEILKSDLDAKNSEKQRIAALLERGNRQKEELERKISDLSLQIEEITAKNTESSSGVLIRIELEKSREHFQKEQRLLKLRIAELEATAEELSASNRHDQLVDYTAKIKRLEEENFRLSQLYQASLHKIDYYSSLINNPKPYQTAKENKESNIN